MNPAYKLRSIPCNLCGHTAPAPWVEESGFTVCRCPACGLLFVNPQPYDWESGQCQGSFDMYERDDFAAKMGELHQPVFDGVLDVMAKHRAVLPGPHLLDVGCGEGAFMGLAKEAGWEVYGQDISEPACAEAAKRFGAERVICGRLESVVGIEPFDVVTSLYTLEHVEDPMTLFQAIKKILRPGGMLLVRVPNVSGLHRVQRGIARLLGRKPPSVLGGVPVHLFGYSPTIMRRYLMAAGLQRVRLWETRGMSYRGLKGVLAFGLSKGSVGLTGGRFALGPILVSGIKPPAGEARP